MNICELCEMEYDKQDRLGKPGRVTVCEDCAEDDTVPYTGFMVYGHKAGATLQINTDPALTEYLINATKLKNKGSNMTSNVQQVTKYSKLSKTEGACKQTADFWNYKGRAE
jgi:hypothetical protein